MAPNIYCDGIRYSATKDITPADDTDIAFDTNSIMVEVAGDVTFSYKGDITTKFTRAFGAKKMYPVGPIYTIDSTGTTATGITVWA